MCLWTTWEQAHHSPPHPHTPWPPTTHPRALPSPRAQVGGADLGTGHADLWPRVDMDTAVCLSGDGATHCVGDAHSQGPAVLTIAQCQEGVCSLTCHMGPPFQPCVPRTVALPAQAPGPPTHVLSLLCVIRALAQLARSQKGKSILGNFSS